MKKKVLVSGIQSSGRLHIGNYFGAMKQNIDLPNSSDFESYVFIADYHSMTSLTDANERRKSSFDLACAYLACGLDIEKVFLFKQSDVPEHTELSWILSTVTPMPMLMLAHSYKDKIWKYFLEEAEKTIQAEVSTPERKQNRINFLFDYKNYKPQDLAFLGFGSKRYTQEENLKNIQKVADKYSITIEDVEFLVILLMNKEELSVNKINAGLSTYPVLMAADILMYQADVVPVGKDQEQHIEMTREMAGKFNRTYTDFFKMPQSYIMPDVAIVPGTDGEKMSKSKGNVIPLFGTDAEIKKAVMSIVTDAKSPSDVVNPDENNIYNIHKLFLNKEDNDDLRNRFLKVGKYAGGSYSYKEAKDALCESIIAFVRPMRERYDYYQSHPDEVYDILAKGKIKAQVKARETMSEVRRLVGLDNCSIKS